MCVTATGKPIDYTARWTSYPVLGADGEAIATVSATAYVAEPVDPARPVTFLFNGGPGASSSPLHMGAFGPNIFSTTVDGGREIVPNPHTLLDCSDLVFVDPVGTGFSRELAPDGGAPYLTVHGDAASVEGLIRRWLTEHGRAHSPLHLVGESFGGFRLATLCASIADLPVAGLVLISPLLDATATAPGNDLTHALELPTMAVAAWFHGLASPNAADAAEVFDTAEVFARDDYLRALHQGSALDPAERHRVGGRLAALLGLPVEVVLDADLRVDSEDFLRRLLADRDELVGRLDVRVTGPMPPPPDPDGPPTVDDPALGMIDTNVRHSDALADYLRTHAGATAEGPYVSLSLELGFRFDWRSADREEAFYVNQTTHLVKLLKERPQARALLIGGYFDLATVLSGTIHAATHSGMPTDRTEVLTLTSGHSLEPSVLPAVTAAVRKLITHAPGH
nr:hypothetical protein [Amycolatopsis jejuensis]